MSHESNLIHDLDRNTDDETKWKIGKVLPMATITLLFAVTLRQVHRRYYISE